MGVQSDWDKFHEALISLGRVIVAERWHLAFRVGLMWLVIAACWLLAKIL